ncbi:TetR/AcrR family transcriptional regulator [Vibrio chagasii]|uniref:TetR/AcrR family transcriptional regulator n=1 Tax=Vibrio chagasii TaxID=170679 RepID=UPI003DA03D05
MPNNKRKGRPSQVSKADIVDCALNLGLTNLSMHSIGKQLGVSATALYRHVSSKEELISLCCDHVMEKVASPTDQEWTQYLSSFAVNFREALLSIPGSIEFVRANQQFTPASSIIANDVLGIFREAQVDAEVGFMAFASVFTKVTDIVQHQERAEFLEHSDEPPRLPNINSEQLPNLAWLFEQTKPVDYGQYFEDGIKITIEGLKWFVAKPSQNQSK